MTPSTRTGTLSRVMTCWWGMSSVEQPGVDEAHRVQHREHQDDPGALEPVELTEPQHHPPLPLRRHPHDVAQVERDEERDDDCRGEG